MTTNFLIADELLSKWKKKNSRFEDLFPFYFPFISLELLG